ncbi:hypothetical protein FRC00_004335 [Tulasnella sp. 408]|nr:hypothetical protein FRC00_004335 [Tulasnella sp. 408]
MVALTFALYFRVPTRKEPTTSGTERLIDPDIGSKTAASTAVILDVKATGGTDEPSETSTKLTEPIVEPACRAETASQTAAVHVATQGYNKSTMRRIDHESLKLGDIILVECVLNPHKANE